MLAYSQGPRHKFVTGATLLQLITVFRNVEKRDIICS